MEFLKAYIRERKYGIFLFFLSEAVFASVFFLYRIPIQIFLYPAVLCVILAILFLSLDFLRKKRKHERLFRLQGMTTAMTAAFPEKETVEDKDYQELLEAVLQEAAELENQKNLRYQEMLDYYTVWVHQIKTPIAAMKLNLQKEDTAEARRLSSELFRIEQYVEMVLAYLRLDAPSNDYVFREHSLDEIIRQSVKRFAPEFIGKKIRLAYEPVEKSIITDEKWLSFVLEQVISNALKYTKEGSVKIYMKEPEVLCIEDTGIGIAPSDLPRIFEKGYTGYNGRSGASSSGIGLYLCRRILKKLGAKISAESEVGKGTKIMIYLEQYPLKTE